MKTLLSSLFFLFQITLFAQNVDFIREYHPFINKAELAIIDKDFAEAFQNYKTAFQRVPNGFARDYHNAILCAIEVDDKDFAFDYLKRLVGKGVEKRFFIRNKNYYFHSLNQDPRWENFLHDYEWIKDATFSKTVDHEANSVLGVLANKDQEVREGNNRSSETILQIDKENITALVAVIDAKGFPTEEMLGLWTPMWSMNLYHLVILHHMKNWKVDNNLVDIRPILWQAVKDGKLSANKAAYYLDLSESEIGGVGFYGSSGLIRLQGDKRTYDTIEYSKDEVVIINENRAKLGLCNLTEQTKKLKYHIIEHNRNSKFILTENGGLDTYPKDVVEFLPLRVIE